MNFSYQGRFIVFCYIYMITHKKKQVTDECFLCGTFGGDRLEHIIACDALRKFAFTFWGRHFNFSFRDFCTLCWSGAARPFEGDNIKILAIHLFAALKLYNHARHGGKSAYGFYHAAIVALCGNCPTSRRIVQHYRISNWNARIDNLNAT